MQIENHVAEILKAGRSEGNLFYLPTGMLDRKTYMDVNKVLEAMGGKWKGGKTKAHVFEDPCAKIIQSAIDAGEITNRKQELNLFETPDKIADQLCQLADLKDGQTIFEPSAGRGKIMQAIARTGLNLNVVWCEIDEENRNHLVDEIKIGKMIGDNFLSDGYGFVVDRVIMNPPFSMNGTGRQTDIDHVTHALKFLNEGGILVSIMSPAIKFRDNRKTTDFMELINNYAHEIIDLPDGVFKESGTGIKTVILKVHV